MVLPEQVRADIVRHAESERPNEACGIVALRAGVAERYIPGVNGAASPYRFELEVAPDVWFLEDDGYELAVFHSHLSSPPRPSRTDVETIGLWDDKPYLIYTVALGTFGAWRIADDRIVEEPLSES